MGKAAAEASLAVLALDAQDGKPLWTQPFSQLYLSLQYADAQDVLVQGPANAGGHNDGPDRSGEKVVAYRGSDGKELWTQKPEVGPYLLHGERLITQEARAYDLRTGAPKGDFGFKRGRCSPMVGAQNLLTYRGFIKEPAGYFDLLANREGNFHSVRPGCQNNMIAGDGVLVVPMLANGCTCSYPIYTSLALIHMPYPEQAPGR